MSAELLRRCAISIAAVFALFILVMPSLASEQVEICAEYTDTGRLYHVTAISTTGLELNQATHSRNYNSIGRYIVIFWAPDQASVIEMGGVFVAPLHFASSGTDQEGRSWEISIYSPAKCGGHR
jgi:hypothetical protein